MKFNKRWLWLIVPILIFSSFWISRGPSLSVSTVLLGIKGTITDGNLIKFSGIAGVGEDAGIAASNVTKNKFDATSAPTVNNDTDEGYTVGSKWCDVTADKGYFCLDNTDGAAVWVEVTSEGTTVFTGLTDTPANYTGEAGKYAKVNVGEDALEFDTPAGTTVFTGLTDTPADYTGQAGLFAKVNVGETALEFAAGGGGENNTASNIGAQVGIYKQKTGVDLELKTLKAESDKIIVSTDTGAVGWYNPVGWIDPDTQWSNETYAYDDDTGTYASDSIPNTGWGSFLELENYSPCSSLRFWANYSSPNDITKIDLDAYYGSVWNHVYEGSFADEQWVEKILGATYQVDKARARFWNNYYQPRTAKLFEFEFYQEAGVLDYIWFDVVPSEIAKEIGGLLSTTTIAFNADADTALYTVPTGKRCVLTHAIVVAADDAGATTTVSIGANGAETDFIPANTLSNLDAQYDAVTLQPIPNTTPLKIKSYAAATVIEAQVASQSGVAGNTIYLFGITY